MCKVKFGIQGKGTRGMLQTPGGWKTQTLPPQLGKLTQDQWVLQAGSDRVVRNAPTIQTPNTTGLGRARSDFVFRRNKGNDREGNNKRTTTGRDPCRTGFTQTCF